MFNTYLLYVSSFLVTAFLLSRMPLELRYSGNNSIKKKIRCLFYLVFASFFPLFLSSVRYGIGIDYSTYRLIFEKFQHASFGDYWSSSVGYEFGNFLLIKIGYALFGNTEGVFAVYAFFTIVLLVSAVNYYRERVSVGISTLVVFFLFYSGSYNTVRQHLAIAVVIFAYRYIEKKQLVKYLVFIAIATSFHSTAIIMVFAYYLNMYSVEKDNDKSVSNKFLSMDTFIGKILIAAIIISPVIMGGLLNYVSMIPIFSRYFSSYDAASYDITTSLILKLPVYIPLLLAYKVNVRRNNINMFYYIMLLLEFELLLTSTIFKWGFRLSYYAIFAQAILVGVTVKNTANRASKIILSTYFIGWFALQFWVLNFVMGRDAIWPYVSIFG